MNDNRHLFNLTEREQALLPELQSWLPEALIDVHQHAGLADHVVDEHPRMMGSVSSSTFLFCSREMHRQIDENYGLRPRKRVVFPFPFVGIDVPAANQYVLAWADDDPTVVPFLAGISNTPDEESYTLDQMATGRYRGLKLYYDQGPVRARSIWQFYTPRLLDFANLLGLPIMLHLPSDDLPKDLDELDELSRRYPRITIIVAHMGGGGTTAEGFRASVSRLARLENVIFDTSCCVESGVFQAALIGLGAERILYASDQPYNAHRRLKYNHPTKGAAVMADRLYSWVDPEEWRYYQERVDQITCVHLQNLIALRQAIEMAGDISSVEQIFRGNAERWLGL